MPSTVLLPIWLPAQGVSAPALEVEPPQIDESAFLEPTVTLGQTVEPPQIDESAFLAPTVAQEIVVTPAQIDEEGFLLPTSTSGLVITPAQIDEGAFLEPSVTLDGELVKIPLTLVGFVGEPLFEAANSSGNRFKNDGNVALIVRNSSGAPRTVTVLSMKRDNQDWLHHESMVVPAGGLWLMGPFRPQRFNSVDGYTTVNYDSATGLEVGAVQLLKTP